MSYMALYRKFRPQEFADVKGQEHIVTTLKLKDIANFINNLKEPDKGRPYRPCISVLWNERNR